MCGIFGVISGESKSINNEQLVTTIKELFILSESRGKEASGFAAIHENEIIVHKTPFPASKMVKSNEFIHNMNIVKENNNGFFACIGHSRLVTSGYEHFNYNNQPIIKNNMVGMHNGIIVNVDDLWERYPDEQKETDLDSEIIPVIIHNKKKRGHNLKKAVSDLYQDIYGMTNIAFFFKNYSNLLLASNNGSIYYINDKDFFVFASEHFILEQLVRRNMYLTFISDNPIKQLIPNTAILVNFINNTVDLKTLNVDEEEFNNLSPLESECEINEILLDEKLVKKYKNTSLEYSYFEPTGNIIDEYEKRKEEIGSLKRCTKCILPETFPFIDFDEQGECNYCRNYKKIIYKGSNEFVREFEPYRRTDGRPELLVPFSGGRDSSYALHYVVKELGLKPLAYSYDWGMLTDLARRNQARMCDRLGVEHILISADIRKKRINIRKNVTAWLKRPNLGTVPLFMAGDKQYFFYSNQLMKQNDLKLSLLGENHLETTKFKSGFCGIRPKFDKERTYSLTFSDKLQMLGFYGKEYILNPAFLNSSLLDTMDAFKSYYVIKHRIINLFDYIQWDEKIISDTLSITYDWETDPGTKTTWRIGDGTAAFYNYIYYIIAGFTENDTFRSNQIREGYLIREEALKLTTIENNARWNSMQWYCSTIGLEFEPMIDAINKIKPLYAK